MPYLVASAAILSLRLGRRGEFRSAARVGVAVGWGFPRRGPGLPCAFPRAAPPACGGRVAVRAAGTRWSGSVVLGRYGAGAPTGLWPLAGTLSRERLIDATGCARRNDVYAVEEDAANARNRPSSSSRLVCLYLKHHTKKAPTTRAPARSRPRPRNAPTKPPIRVATFVSRETSQAPRGAPIRSLRGGSRGVVNPSARPPTLAAGRDAEGAAPAWWV